MDNIICHCFGYTGEDIKKDVIEHGRSLIMEKIIAEKKTGGCDCANLNPKGRWCLPDVRQVVDDVADESFSEIIKFEENGFSK